MLLIWPANCTSMSTQDTSANVQTKNHFVCTHPLLPVGVRDVADVHEQLGARPVLVVQQLHCTGGPAGMQCTQQQCSRRACQQALLRTDVLVQQLHCAGGTACPVGEVLQVVHELQMAQTPTSQLDSCPPLATTPSSNKACPRAHRRIDCQHEPTSITNESQLGMTGKTPTPATWLRGARSAHIATPAIIIPHSTA